MGKFGKVVDKANKEATKLSKNSSKFFKEGSKKINEMDSDCRKKCSDFLQPIVNECKNKVKLVGSAALQAIELRMQYVGEIEQLEEDKKKTCFSFFIDFEIYMKTQKLNALRKLCEPMPPKEFSTLVDTYTSDFCVSWGSRMASLLEKLKNGCIEYFHVSNQKTFKI